jgi:hypothetical protein
VQFSTLPEHTMIVGRGVKAAIAATASEVSTSAHRHQTRSPDTRGTADEHVESASERDDESHGSAQLAHRHERALTDGGLAVETQRSDLDEGCRWLAASDHFELTQQRVALRDAARDEPQLGSRPIPPQRSIRAPTCASWA